MVLVSVVFLLVSSVLVCCCSYLKNIVLFSVLYFIILVRFVCSLCGGRVVSMWVLVIIVCGGWNVLIRFLLVGMLIVVLLFIDELIIVNRVVGSCM